MRGMKIHAWSVVALSTIVCLAAGLWLAMACGQQTTDPTPEVKERTYDDPATLCASEGENMNEEKVTVEQAKAVLDEHRERFLNQPNLVRFGIGHLRDTDGNILWDEIGIFIGVSERVDQSTLPEEDRIPSCLDGVPVQFEIREPIEYPRPATL